MGWYLFNFIIGLSLFICLMYEMTHGDNPLQIVWLSIIMILNLFFFVVGVINEVKKVRRNV